MVALSALDSQWYWRGRWKNWASGSSRQERAKWFAFLLDSVLCLTARHPAGLIVESPGHGSVEVWFCRIQSSPIPVGCFDA